MTRVAALVIAGIASLACAATADAADMRPRRKAPPPPPPPVVEESIPIAVISSGWYLRGDIGYRWYDVSHTVAPTGFPDPTDNQLGNGFWGGLGSGFKSNALRVDATLDYGSSVNYRGTMFASGDVSAKLQAFSALVNFYYEPYTWDRFTPYIGAGVGTARVKLSDFTSPTVPLGTAAPETTQWNLAYALMVGTAFALSRNLALDVGYRYLNLGSVDTAADAAGQVVQLKNIAAHEFRVGLRWTFADPPLFMP
jgi:opacity protein-like surface antigen